MASIFSPAGQALGLDGGNATGFGAGYGGSDLANQVAGDTDELRKKRLQELLQQRQARLGGMGGMNSLVTTALGGRLSAAGSALFNGL